MTKKQKYSYAIGKRRTASARIRLYKGKGQNLVNDMPMEKYFPGDIAKTSWIKPFSLTNTFEKYYITAKVEGGGKEGQLKALVHGIARALAKENPEKFRKLVKEVGLLERDSRIRERRKVGMGGKSRRVKQSPKR